MVLKFLGQALALRGSRMCTINTGTGYSGDNVGTTYLRMHRTNRSLEVYSYQRCRRRKTCSSRSRCHGDRTSRMRRAGNGRLDPRAPAAASASAHPAAGNGRTVSEHIPPLLQRTHPACSSWGRRTWEMCSARKWPLSPNRRPATASRAKKKHPNKTPAQMKHPLG